LTCKVIRSGREAVERAALSVRVAAAVHARLSPRGAAPSEKRDSRELQILRLLSPGQPVDPSAGLVFNQLQEQTDPLPRSRQGFTVS